MAMGAIHTYKKRRCSEQEQKLDTLTRTLTLPHTHSQYTGWRSQIGQTGMFLPRVVSLPSLTIVTLAVFAF